MDNKYGITFAIEYITPEIAQKYLDMNCANRRIRQGNVNSISKAILRGEWVLTHQGLGFSKSGFLLDGQHRLRAVIDAGTGVDMVVTRGLSDASATFYGIDIGVKRSTEDQLRENKRDTEVARLLSRIIFGASPSAQQVLEILDCGVRDAHQVLMNIYSGNTRFFASTPIRTAAVILMMSGKDLSYITKTYSNLCAQKLHELDSMPLQLVKQYANRKVDSGRVSETYVRAMKALDPAYRNNTKLTLNDGDIESVNKQIKTVIKGAIASTGWKKAA